MKPAKTFLSVLRVFLFRDIFAAQWLRRRALTPYPDCPGRASSILCFTFSFGRINGDAAAEETREHANPKGFNIEVETKGTE